ncbi:exported protein of unknown function [Nitrospira japonica]|uniref:Uncharacterized protein n=1 Tax=Nitrospira japonica TaxID=1325564 RepID=A0A1W1HZR2_9BACT|nr:hypothetical protein [Nitrospira japonica]SLM46207.1 exported protein of unknown function [Nitrospira japonica]
MFIAKRIPFLFLAAVSCVAVTAIGQAEQWDGPDNLTGTLSRSGHVTVGEQIQAEGPKALLEVTRPLGASDDRNDRLFSANNLYKGATGVRFEVDTRHAYAGAARGKIDILPADMDFAVHRKAAIGVSTINERLPGDYTLIVGGKILAEEVRIKLIKDWSDYVFNTDYALKPLPEVERFIHTHRHLPAIPSSAEVEQDGINLGHMQAKLLQKVEELTLYVIEQHKAIEVLQRKLTEVERVNALPDAAAQP